MNSSLVNNWPGHCNNFFPNPCSFTTNSGEQARAQAAASAEAAAAQQAAMAAVEAEAKHEIIVEPSASSTIDLSKYTHRVVSFLARNFYNLKYVALVLAFCINFMLLFYKVM